MFTIDQQKLLRHGRCAAVMTVTLVVLGSLASSVQANGDTFSARVSEKEKMLKCTDTTGVLDQAMVDYLETDTSFQRLVTRSTPWVELTNNSATDPILQFIMTLGDPQYEFGDVFLGDYAVVGKTTPGIDIVPSIAEGGSELTITFPDGLQQGETVRFRIDLDDVSDGTSFPDYRDVLLVPPGSAMSSTDTTISAVFGPSGEDPITVGPMVFVDNRTGISISTTQTASGGGGCCCGGGGGGPLDPPFGAGDPPSTVPEPSSVVLGLAGLLGGFGACRRRRARISRCRQ